MKRISIIIPSYNSRLTVRGCLQSVYRQQGQVDYEIILVDSSNDQTAEIVEQYFPRVKLIKLSQKTDPGTARNIGVQSASGELLAFIDSDCIASSGWLENILIAHELECGGVGGPVANANKHSLIGWAGYFLEFSEWLPSKSSQTIGHIPSCNISYKRDVFKEVGGFPSLLLPPSGAMQEDYLLNLYIKKAGYRILYDPKIEVSHFNRTDIIDFIKHQYGRGTSAFLIRQLFPEIGSLYLKYPLLSVGVLPARTAAIFSRIITRKPAYLFNFVITLPLLMVGIGSWVVGFIKQAKRSV